MAVKFETLKVGDVLYDCHTYGIGNTRMRAMGCWPVKILELQPNGAIVSWNGNQPERYRRSDFRSSLIRRLPPEFVKHPIDGATCHFCGGNQRSGHRDDCEFPVNKRKKSA